LGICRILWRAKGLTDAVTRNWQTRRVGLLFAHSEDCSHRFRSKPAICSERSQPGIPMIPAG
jgi:hypothetical protein